MISIDCLRGKKHRVFLATKMKIWTDLKGKVVDLSSKRGGTKTNNTGQESRVKKSAPQMDHHWICFFSGRIYRFFQNFPMTSGGFPVNFPKPTIDEHGWNIIAKWDGPRHSKWNRSTCGTTYHALMNELKQLATPIIYQRFVIMLRIDRPHFHRSQNAKFDALSDSCLDAWQNSWFSMGSSSVLVIPRCFITKSYIKLVNMKLTCLTLKPTVKYSDWQ